jgi:hypothetical protein
MRYCAPPASGGRKQREAQETFQPPRRSHVLATAERCALGLRCACDHRSSRMMRDQNRTLASDTQLDNR